MMSQKRLDCGFSGSGDPPVPRAARSVRRRSLVKSKRHDQQMHAFDLLATVAGDLLSDRKSSSPSVVDDCTSKEENSTDKPLDDKSCDQEFRERNFLCTELVSEAPDSNCCREEFPCAQNNAASRPTSLVFAEQLVDDCKLRLGICTPIVNVESSALRTSVNCELKDENRNQIETDNINCRNLSNSKMAKVSNSGHLDASDKKSYPVVSSVDSVNHPLGRDHTPCGSYLVNRGNVKLVNRDDDENFSKYTESSTRNKVFRPSGYVGDSRIRKLPKVTSSVRDDDCFGAVTERCNYLNRKHNLKLQRSARDYPLKKRKLYDCSSVSNSVEGTKSDRVRSVHENSTNGGVSSSGPVLQGDALIRTPASAAKGNTSFGSNHQVKLKIKSFRVPEMFLEFPESTTVGFLKKTVMEAVNAVFGGGLRVGVILQGEKIRDDNRTLLQTGISHDNKMETLGFTLEPNIAQTPIKFRADRPAHRLHDDPQPLARYPPIPGISWNAIQAKSLRTAQLEPPETNSNNYAESDRDSAPFPLDVSLKKTVLESKALVSVPSTEPDALVAVPFQKSKRSESAQRRIRRPFTVSEVEALVHAVEKLGTGRWRDVKLRAFDNAKHRTYVDLKDKWKTLVHTARISPQQRRGEPVPQELLDRVLAAHAYWSHHQAKHQLKSHPETCLLL